MINICSYDKIFYNNYNEFYPGSGKTANISSVIAMRGHRLAGFIVHPVRFKPITGELLVCRKVRFRIEFIPKNGLNKGENAYLKKIKNSSYDFFADWPFGDEDLYKKIDKNIPKSKFILTIREKESLRKSWVNYFKNSPRAKKRLENISDKMDEIVYRNKEIIDYFKDDLVLALINWIYNNLLPGGRILLGQVHKDFPIKPYLDHILDWKLIYRSEKEIKELFSASKFQKNPVKIEFEDSGTQMFCSTFK